MNDVLVGLQITVLGMASVFCILVFLSLAMHLMYRLLGQPKEIPPPSLRPSAGRPASAGQRQADQAELEQEELMAVIAASAAAYKQISKGGPASKGEASAGR